MHSASSSIFKIYSIYIWWSPFNHETFNPNGNEFEWKKKQFVVLLQIGKWNAIICAPLALFVFILVYSECIFYSPIPNVSSPEEMPEFNRMKKQTFSRWLGKKPRPASRTIKKLRLWKCETLCKCLKFELEKIAKWEN